MTESVVLAQTGDLIGTVLDCIP